MIKLRTKKKVHNRKYRTKKYKGGEKIELSLNNIFLPAPDNISLNNTDTLADIAINSLKMYNVNVSKEKLIDNFGVFVGLVKDAIKKYKFNSEQNFISESNQLLREFSKRYDNYELGVIINSLEYLIQTFNNYNNLDKNISKKEILDKTYEMVLKIHKEYDIEEEEFNSIYEKIEKNNRENQEFYDTIQKGGVAKLMGMMGKFGIVMGALPVITQIMTHNFHINIIEFITGNELMAKLKKILNKIMKKNIGERLKEKREKEKKKKEKDEEKLVPEKKNRNIKWWKEN